MQTFDFVYNRAYQVSSQWFTAVDESFSGNEQRRNLWTNPRKKWVLEFDKNQTDTAAILAFFDARKGRFEAFKWVWKAQDSNGVSLGGDDAEYTVRFDTDQLEFSHIAMGYTTFQITFVEV